MSIIFFDVDGTLLDNKNKQIPTSTINALFELKKRGHTLALSTGRAEYLLHVLDEVISLFDYKITLNGQSITDVNGLSLLSTPLNKNRLLELIADMDKHNILYGLQNDKDEVISRLDDFAINFINEFNLRIPKVDSTFHLSHDIHQAWIYTNKDNVTMLKSKYPEFDFINWGSNGYDITPKGFNKKHGVEYLIKALGFSKDDTYAFGDGDNDSYMFDAVKTSIAMGNGSSLTKSKATFITDSVDNDGVFKGLKAVGLL